MNVTGKSAQEIFISIRKQIDSGELKAGMSLPTVRELADSLGVNRNTVASAYKKLTTAEMVTSNGRAGTVVRKSARAGEQEGLSVGTALIDLADGNPNPVKLPDLGDLAKHIQFEKILYGQGTIHPVLNDFGRNWLGPDCPDHMELELTHGAVDAIERLCFANLVAGDEVAVEDPGFMGTINAVRLSGMKAVGVKLDEHGMVPAHLEKTLKNGARAVLITPRAHNPTGCSLSRNRASEIKKILTNYPDVFVVVDDHFALVSHAQYYNIIPPSSRRWSLIRSVSKGFGPDLRVAFVGCDQTTSERLRARLSPGMSWVSRILQEIVASAVNSSLTQKLITEARDLYQLNQEILHRALKSQGIHTRPGTDGLNIWIPLEGDQKDIAYALAKKGWLVRLGSAFGVQQEVNAIRVTISKLDKDQATFFASSLIESIAETNRSYR